MEKQPPPFDLEARTYEFARRVRLHLKDRDWHRVGWTDVGQLLRSSGSVAANSVESQEAVSDDDFTYRIRLCRKEVRESGLWLRLLHETNDLSDPQRNEHAALLSDVCELTRIFTAILRKRSATS